jgi:hypothetical protein
MHIIANVRLIAQQIAELMAFHVERTEYVNRESAALVVLSIMCGIIVVRRMIVIIVVRIMPNVVRISLVAPKQTEGIHVKAVILLQSRNVLYSDPLL